jgi:hypothetical protein
MLAAGGWSEESGCDAVDRLLHPSCSEVSVQQRPSLLAAILSSLTLQETIPFHTPRSFT